MSEREKHIIFVKKLAQYEQDRSLHELQDQIHQAEQEEKCVRSAAFLVVLIGLASTLGIGYSTIVLENIFKDSTHAFIKLFSVLSLGCMICLIGYLGYWKRHRTLSNRLYEEARSYLISLKETRVNFQSAFNVDITASLAGTVAQTQSHSSSAAEPSDSGLARAA